jgi:hypothetical protein
LADSVYRAHAGEQYGLQALADVHGEDAGVAWPVHGAAPITLNMRADG